MKLRKIIIAGCRDFYNYNFVKKYLNKILTSKTEIISGGAKGVDSLGEQYAIEYGHTLTIFPAEWDKYGKAAGPIRNKQMAEYADMAIVFWDGKSRGTKNMIEITKKLKKPIKIVSIV